MNSGDAHSPRATGALLLLLGARVASVGLATVIGWLLVAAFEQTADYPPSPLISSLALLPVNLLTLWYLARIARSGGSSLGASFGVRKGAGLVRDIAWGFVWIAVLYIPFVVAIIGTMFALHGGEVFEAFATVFFNPDAASVTSPVIALILGIIAVVTFAPLNAPAEEALYRGYTLRLLSSRWSRIAAVTLSSVAFGVQHAFFAPTSDAMIVYVVAFTVWGAGSCIIVLKQGRLMPIVIAHLVVNLMTSSPAVIFPALQIAGVIPA